MGADELSRDLKSQGIHLEQTRLTHTNRLDRLMLALALGYLVGLGMRYLGRPPATAAAREPLQASQVQPVHPGLRWIHRLLTLAALPDVVLMPIP